METIACFFERGGVGVLDTEDFHTFVTFLKNKYQVFLTLISLVTNRIKQEK